MCVQLHMQLPCVWLRVHRVYACVCSCLGVLLCVHRMYTCMYSFLVYPCVCSCLVCDCVYTHVYTCVCVCHLGDSLAVLGP